MTADRPVTLPVEPSEEMIETMCRAAVSVDGSDPDTLIGDPQFPFWRLWEDEQRAAYRALYRTLTEAKTDASRPC